MKEFVLWRGYKPGRKLQGQPFGRRLIAIVCNNVYALIKLDCLFLKVIFSGYTLEIGIAQIKPNKADVSFNIESHGRFIEPTLIMNSKPIFFS